MANTPNLGLPYILAAQSQKHVTHNESIRAVDALVHLNILDRDLAAPPVSPVEGDRYLVAAGPTGAWSGQAGKVAAYQDGAWIFYPPKEGWIAWIADENAALAFDGGVWTTFSGGGVTDHGALTGLGDDDHPQYHTNARGDARYTPINPTTLGINATADTTNRLALASAASLFNHAGAGHQIKVNKNAAADTASFLFQTGFSGRAELGTTGDDDFHFKVSANGTAWNEAIVINKTTGGVTFPNTTLSGETNTASNVNAGGVGVFKQKTGVNLEFRGINAGSNKVTIVSDTANNEIDIDVAEANLTLSNLGGSIDLGGAKASGTIAAARFPAHTGDVTSTAGSVALSIAPNAVTNAKAAQMAANTIKGNNTGSTANATDLTAAQVTTMLPDFVASGAAHARGLVPDPGATAGTTKFLREDGSWSVPASGGGGSPSGQIQYNNAGAFGGAAGAVIDGGDLLLLGSTPATPPASSVKLFRKPLAGRQMPAALGPNGLAMVFQPLMAQKRVGLWRPHGNATTAPTAEGIAAPTATGTATARNVATTNLLTSMRRLGYVSAATAGSLSGARLAAAQFWRGNAANLGGFFAVCRFGVSDAAAVSGARMFVGFSASTGAPTNVEPNTIANSIGVGQISTSNNLQLITRDATTAQTIDLGASFPANTLSADAYELTLSAAPNGADVGYRVERVNTGDVAEGTLTTNLPVNTALLGWQMWRTNNATALAVGLDLVNFYIETDY